MMKRVVELSGAFAECRPTSGPRQNRWVGFSLNKMEYTFYLYVDSPEIVRFEKFRPLLDPTAFDVSVGEIRRTYGKLRWENHIDLERVGFFSVEESRQREILERFLAESLDYAQRLPVVEPAMSP